MPETAQAIHDSKDLREQVGDLLDQMEAGTQQLAKDAAPAEAQPPAPAADAAAPASGEGSQGADYLADAVAELASGGTSPAVGEGVVQPDLAAAVERLMDQGQTPPAPDAAASPVPAAKAEQIDSLDAELAGLADNLIAGEFTEEKVPESAEPQAAAPAVEPVAAAVEAPAPVEPETAAPEPVREALALTALPPPPMTPAPAAAAPVVRGAPLALRVLSVASAPVRSNPHLRDTLGWVALVQGFLGVCVWVYVMFFRSNIPLDPPPVKAAEHSEKSHAQAKDKAQAKDAKPPAEKKAPKKTAAKSGGHH